MASLTPSKFETKKYFHNSYATLWLRASSL